MADPHYREPSNTRQVSTATPIAWTMEIPAAHTNRTAFGNLDNVKTLGKRRNTRMGKTSEIDTPSLQLDVAIDEAVYKSAGPMPLLL